MESDSQHFYGARVDSVPCGWSRTGACDMARLASRREGGRAVSRMTGERSATPRRRRRQEARELRSPERAGARASEVVQSSGSGYEPSHRASVAQMAPPVPLATGPDSGPSRMREPAPPSTLRRSGNGGNLLIFAWGGTLYP